MPTQLNNSFFVSFIDLPRITKTKELILHIASHLASNNNYGEVMLNKALYFVDNVNYLKNRFPISTLTYLKKGNHPAPEVHTWLPVKQELLDSGEISIVGDRIISNRNADMSHFTSEEMSVINDIVPNIDDWSHEHMPGLPHDNISFITAEHDEPLPFFAFLTSRKMPPSKESIEWAKAEMNRVLGH